MSDNDLKDMAKDATDETSEYDNLADFVDLEDLSSLMDEDDFMDLEDLGDISDLDLDGDGILDEEREKSTESGEEPEIVPDTADPGSVPETAEPEQAPVSIDAEAALLQEETPDKTAAEDVSQEKETPADYEDMVSLSDLPDLSEIEGLDFSDDPEQLQTDSSYDIPDTDGESQSLDDMVGGFLDDLDAAGGAAGQTEEDSEPDIVTVEPEMTAGPVEDMTEDSAEITDNIPDAVDAETTVPDTADAETNVPDTADAETTAPDAADAIREETTGNEPEEEEAVFGLDDILALEPEEDGQPDDMQGLLEGLTEDSIPELPTTPEEEKPGLLKRLFGNIVTDEIAKAEIAQREKDKEEEAAKQEAAEAAKEEKKAAKAAKAEEKAEAKKAKAEEKELKKAAKAEEKAQKKAEKEAQKAEEAAQEELEVTGKLNKVGVSIVVILAAMFLATEISGTEIFSYNSTMKQAESFFEAGKYTDAYREILGTNMKNKDQETYDKIVTVMKVQRSLNSYENYDNMKYYPDALNALLVGLSKYDENIETARNLEIEKDVDGCKEKILTLLDEEYGLSEDQAREILSLKKDAYTDRVVELGLKKQNS